MSKKFLAIFFLFVFGFYLIWNPVQTVFSSGKSKGIIVIDVGHGGSDPGKVSEDGTEEKDINLEIAGYLRDYLTAQDFTVYMDREEDRDLAVEGASGKKRSDMRNRILFFEEKKADCVISIHQNSFPEASSHGAQVFYYGESGDGKKLASYIQKELLEFDTTNKRGAKENTGYYILKKSKMPAVIVECGFLSNPEELAKLKDKDYQKKLAYTISKGICKYFRN